MTRTEKVAVGWVGARHLEDVSVGQMVLSSGCLIGPALDFGLSFGVTLLIHNDLHSLFMSLSFWWNLQIWLDGHLVVSIPLEAKGSHILSLLYKIQFLFLLRTRMWSALLLEKFDIIEISKWPYDFVFFAVEHNTVFLSYCYFMFVLVYLREREEESGEYKVWMCRR
jgi:hypothetical protein